MFPSQDLITSIAKSYNVLYSIVELKKILISAFPQMDFHNYDKYHLHKFINDIVLRTYKGELKIKALLVEKFIKEDAISCFEIKTNTSRLDFLRINGSSISYEIKSELDTLFKLEKQIDDYSKLFEYNYVVIDESHYTKAIRLIPENYGIYIFAGKDLEEIKKPQINIKIDCEKQISLLTKKELNSYFNISTYSTINIFSAYSESEINRIFKDVLKNRYKKKWHFLVNERKQILPIDYQFFFQNNIPPEIIYGQIS
jgi:hypothetical protein